MQVSTAYSVRLAAILISLTLVILGLYWFKDLLIILSFALVFALLLLPLVQRMEAWGLPRSLSIFIAILVMLGALVALILILSAQIAEFVSDWPLFVKKAESYLNTLQRFLSQNLNISRKKQMLELSNQTLNLLKNSGSILGTTFETLLRGLSVLILIPIFTFFTLFYRHFFAHFLAKVFPQVGAENLRELMAKMAKVVQSYLVGMFLVMLLVAGLNILGFWWIGVNYFLFFGILTGILLLIPYVGIWIGAFLPILFSLVFLGPNYALGVMAWVAFVQFFEANVVTPLVVGSKVSVNPIVALVALLLGELIWGIPGLILALPFTAILKVIFDFVPALEAYGFLIGEVPKRASAPKPRPSRSRASKKATP